MVAWVDVVEDLSGVEPPDAGWWSGNAMPGTVRALLGEIGRVYAPFLLANAAAVERRAERVDAMIDGHPWVQRHFPYQAKCLGWLRADYATLGADDRGRVDALLERSGCEILFRG